MQPPCYFVAVKKSTRRGRLVAIFALLAALLAPQNALAITHPDRVAVIPDEVPWLVTFWQIDSRFDRVPTGYSCGGALIDPYTVLTTARCIDSVSDTGFALVLGQRYSTSRGLVVQPRTVTQYPRYRAGSFQFDLAIVDLYSPVAASQYLRVATNPEVSILLRKPSVLYGWGENQRGKLPSLLRRVVQNDMSAIAKQLYPDFLLRTQLAVGRMNRDNTFSGACNLDVGSPLVGTVKGKPVLLGVFSYGALKTCNTKTPRVFTRTSWFGPWVARMQAENAQERRDAGIEFNSVLYYATGGAQLPATSGSWTDERTYISQVASFGTESATAGQSDIARIDAYALAPSEAGNDIVIDIKSRTPWSGDSCEWRNLAADGNAPLLRMTIRSNETGKFRSAYQFTFEADSENCFGDSGLPMTVAAFNGQQLPNNCAPKLSISPLGSARVTLQVGCFTTLAKTALRVELRTQDAYELEPGIDEWAGPFNLKHPERTA